MERQRRQGQTDLPAAVIQRSSTAKASSGPCCDQEPELHLGVSPTAAGAQGLGGHRLMHSQVNQQGAGLKIEHPGQELVLTW